MSRLALFLALATPLAGQPLLRVTTRLVQVDVVAHDRHGAVADLTKQNFTVFDRGRPQPVAVFEKRLAESRTAPTGRTPRVFTNDSTGPNAATALSTVIVLDILNSELRLAMVGCGTRSLAEISSASIIDTGRRG